MEYDIFSPKFSPFPNKALKDFKSSFLVIINISLIKKSYLILKNSGYLVKEQNIVLIKVI